MARKILLADDSVTAQNMGRKILADAGYEVITVNNGSAALKRIAEIKPDVIVLDVYMPGYSGLEVCQRLKESNDTARIPILLTVGKLEPFKPEEAKRVRAEAFIVKPFEASELLSALAKLEDKIVPRADSSKPGRFARAIAAVEEGRYDKSVSVEEDAGWKNRISFPKKKKEKPVEPEDGDDAAIYNAVNRDLKTVVEHKPEQVSQPVTPASQPPAQQEANVDLGALVAHGLPKDVTPEEIAALAAAAAQVQGITESASSLPVSVPAVMPETRQDESNKPPEVSSSQPVPPEAIAEQTTESAVAAAHEANLDGKPKEDKSADDRLADDKPIEVQPKVEPQESASVATAGEAAREEPSSLPADALPAIASYATDEATASPGNGASAHALSRTAEPESVTMAVASGRVASTSRWTAVAVALAPEETTIALEEEMRSAQAAALAAALETTSAAVEVRTLDHPNPSFTAPAAEATVAQAESSAGSVADSPATVNKEAPVTIASPSGVVKEFETVTSREPERSPAAAETPVDLPSPVTPAVPEAVEGLPAVSAATENKIDNNVTDLPATSIATDSVAESASSPAINEAAASGPVSQNEPAHSDAAAASGELPRSDQPPAESANSAPILALPEVDSSLTAAPEPGAPQPDASHDHNEPSVAATPQEVSGGPSEITKKESDITATTAAAWASWRRVRETADGPSAGSGMENESAPRDEAAMAVAAGAEKPHQDSSDAEEAPEIASIVDSVLADLRPKIVQEISKKLGKKK